MSRVIRTLPVNRVEGDLEIRVEMEGDIVRNAWSVGTMYRGFENIMRGRGPLDGLVITPRVCGICSTAHLNAAAKALDYLFEASVPANGTRIRNITLGAETLQNDVRHATLLFMCDFLNPAYSSLPLYPEAVERYEPLKGSSATRTISETSKLLEIIAILGGQWPHSSFMVPGGVVSTPGNSEFVQCRVLLNRYRSWYEKEVLGCSLERWSAVKTRADLDSWLDEKEAHQQGDLGFFIRFSRAIGLETQGRGCGNFLSFGSLDIPRRSGVAGIHNTRTLLPAGFLTASEEQPLDHQKITEDVAYSWLSGGEDRLHPSKGITAPYASGDEGDRYTWAKAPRYDGAPAETGPLAELAISRHPLMVDLLRTGKPNVFVRELARIIRPAVLLAALDAWLEELPLRKEKFFQEYRQRGDGEGFGLIEAPRGALGHWVTLKNNKIASYQIITPTTWNASPRDAAGVCGPMEQALIGTRVKDIENPIELGHIVRSFDPCLVCTVHAVTLGLSPKPFTLSST
jgi:hydrogenase large subunit